MQKKYKKAIFCLLIAFLFHKSSLLFVVIWMLYYLCDKHFKMMSKKKVFLLAPISVVLLMSFFIEILEMLVNIGLTEEKYMERYGSDEAYGASFPISLFAINVFNYVMYMFMTKRIQSSSFVIFSKYILLMGMLLCFTGLISTFAVRMNLYFMMTAIVCIVYALQTCKYRYSWIFVSFYLFYWVMVVVVANLSDTYPYHSAILGL